MNFKKCVYSMINNYLDQLTFYDFLLTVKIYLQISNLFSAHPEGKEVENVHTLPSEMLRLITL